MAHFFTASRRAREGIADPVTGQQTLMLMSEGQEIQVDREQSPHQFSADYGPVQDARYLQAAQQGPQARYASQRLQQWGYRRQ